MSVEVSDLDVLRDIYVYGEIYLQIDIKGIFGI